MGRVGRDDRWLSRSPGARPCDRAADRCGDGIHRCLGRLVASLVGLACRADRADRADRSRGTAVWQRSLPEPRGHDPARRHSAGAPFHA